VWVSKSDKLIEDAQRDWSALGMERLLVTPLSRFRQGTPIRLEQGVLFTTYATLRSDARDEKLSRVKQIVESDSAMLIKDMLMRSPVVSSISSSRRLGCGLT
jgi:P-loop containing NTP hydrolase pore-1